MSWYECPFGLGRNGCWPSRGSQLPRAFCNCSHFVAPLDSIQGFLLSQTDFLCLLLHLLLPDLRSFSLFLSTHFKTLLSSLLRTCQCHLTPFAVANRSIFSFNPNMSICSSVVFLSTNFLTAHGSHHSFLRSPQNCFFIFF